MQLPKQRIQQRLVLQDTTSNILVRFSCGFYWFMIADYLHMREEKRESLPIKIISIKLDSLYRKISKAKDYLYQTTCTNNADQVVADLSRCKNRSKQVQKPITAGAKADHNQLFRGHIPFLQHLSIVSFPFLQPRRRRVLRMSWHGWLALVILARYRPISFLIGGLSQMVVCVDDWCCGSHFG